MAIDPGVFGAYLDSEGLPMPEAEFQFAAPRKWRFDWAYPDCKIAIEVNGGAWTRGRHVRGKGYINDMEKMSEAAARGWRVIHVTPDQLLTDQTLQWIKRAMAA